MPSGIKPLCSLAVLLALLTAQVVGVARGYWCECLGATAPVATVQCLPEECHPGMAHTVRCLDGAEPATGMEPEHCHAHEAPDGPDHRHEHKFLTQEVDFQTFTPMAAPVLLFVAESYAVLPPLIWLEKVPLEGPDIPPVRRDGWSSPPPTAVTRLRIQEMLV